MEASIWSDLEVPRRPTDDGCRLLLQLVAAGEERSLRLQVDGAVAVAVCRCGCSSVRLHGAERPAPTARSGQPSSGHRTDHRCIEATSRVSTGATAQIALHIIEGRIHELEVFAGEGVSVLLADVTASDDLSVH